MAAIDNLNTAVQTLANDVQTLLNQAGGGGTPDPQIQAIADTLSALDQQVKAKLQPTPPAPTP